MKTLNYIALIAATLSLSACFSKYEPYQNDYAYLKMNSSQIKRYCNESPNGLYRCKHVLATCIAYYRTDDDVHSSETRAAVISSSSKMKYRKKTYESYIGKATGLNLQKVYTRNTNKLWPPVCHALIQKNERYWKDSMKEK